MITVPVEEVHDTIESVLCELRKEGHNPFFIQGGGHGDTGTQAYVDCYEEILAYERASGVHFDDIFLASGTGTTQAGLVCGQLLHRDERHIVGISIARKNPRGRDVVVDSVRSYLRSVDALATDEVIQDAVIFDDTCVGNGYSSSSSQIDALIEDIWVRYAFPLDQTYTGKAFYGMLRRLESEGAKERKTLFIHTGGTPLFFDSITAIAGKGVLR